uniref:Uncharacterized protein n=1 Tax=Haptolina brevifila TaxID=156173 RepID=A0A7S2E335_9EUKA
MVAVSVPEGVFEGQEFILEFEGQQLSVTCPDGCGPGSEINLEVPLATGAETSGAPEQQLVEITVPDDCFPGMEFTVEFDGRSFNIAVPDGVNPGDPLTVEVPAEEAPPPARPSPSKAPVDNKPSPGPKREPNGRENQPSQAPPESQKAAAPPQKKQEKPSASKYANLAIPAFKGPRKGETANSVNANARWMSAGDLFSAIPTEGLGKQAGDFEIGQLVQVNRSDGSWTYGKVMDYDPTGDVYTVMTRAGPKYFVERDDISEDVLVNPGDGTCAQQ